MPSSVRLQSLGLCSGEWLEHSLRGVSAQKINISRPSAPTKNPVLCAVEEAA